MIDYIGESLNNLFSDFAGILLLITKTVTFSFNLSCFVGQLIVQLVVSLLTLFLELLLAIKTLLQILVEDYFVFLADLAATFSLLGSAIQQGGEYSLLCLKTLLWSICGCIQTICNVPLIIINSIVTFVSAILSIFYSGLLVIKNSLILVGSSVWSLFTTIPQTFFSFKNGVLSLVICCMKTVQFFVNTIKTKFCLTCYTMLDFITDIPRESVYGLCLFVMTAIVMVRYRRSVYPSAVRCLLYMYSQSQRTLVIAWTCVEAFTLWLVTNQIHAAPRAHNFAAFEGNEPHQDDNSSENNGNNLEEQDHAYLGPEGSHEKPMPNGSESKFEHDQEDRLCVVCQDRERGAIILPCRHVCLCYECCGAIKRTQGRCPLCRNVVRRTMRVFI